MMSGKSVMSERCLTYEQMEELMVNGRLDSAMDHIESCTPCQRLLETCIEEQGVMHQTLYPYKLDDSFTDRIMAVIADEEVAMQQEARNEEATGNVSIMEQLASRKRISRKKWIAAAIILIFASILSFTQPTVANWIKSLFQIESTEDVGLLNSDIIGIHHFVNIEKKDKGYTLEVKEVVADTSRIVIAYRLLRPDGKSQNDYLQRRSIDVVDADGKSIIDPNASFGLHNMEGGEKGKEYGMIDLGLIGILDTDQITIRGNIDVIGWEGDKVAYTLVNGDWRFSIDVDMTEARKKVKEIPLNGEYMATDGTRIKPTRMIFHASTFQIEFQSKLPAGAAPRNEDLALYTYHEIGYYIKDTEGKYIALSERDQVYHDFDERPAMFPLRSSCTLGEEGDSKVVTCIDTFGAFKDLGILGELGIDDFHFPKFTNHSISFSLASLEDGPAVFRAAGDEFQMLNPNGFEETYVSKAEGIKKSLKVKAIGTMSTDSTGQRWIAQDEKGHEYPIDVRGSYVRGGIDYDGDFTILGLDHMPKKLTLTRTATDFIYRDINWKMKLPAYKHSVSWKYEE